MAEKGESSTGLKPKDVPSREDFSDFAIVCENGQELHCHKIKLAEVSPVFYRMMMKKDCTEMKTNKIQMTEFDQETVEGFLDYIYADLELVPVQNQYKKKFYQKRLTAELLRFSHMYDVKNLMEKCVEHLKKNVGDANAVEVWTVAEAIGHEELKKVALEHLGKKKDKLLEVAGMRESFQSPQLMESLVNYLIRQPIPPKDENSINIRVKCESRFREMTTVTIQVKQSDFVKNMKALTDKRLEEAGFPHWKCCIGSFRTYPSGEIWIEDHRTLGYYNLVNQSTICCNVVYVN